MMMDKIIKQTSIKKMDEITKQKSIRKITIQIIRIRSVK